MNKIDLTPALKAVATDPNLIQNIKQAFATTYALAALAKNAHWNVEGANFFELHETFDDIYADAVKHYDDLAERVRQLGEYIPVDLTAIQRSAAITQPVPPQTANDWVKAVIVGIQRCVVDLQAMEKIAGLIGDLHVQDLGIQQVQVYQKHLWMLRSVSK